MTRGFVTLAVGDESYYKMAQNLLLSYRFHTKKDIPFAIICDRENYYTTSFDNVVIIEKTTLSYLDKLAVLDIAPFDENIFIDADCLIYGDLNDYWQYMPKTGMGCFGKSLDLDSHDGWFEKDNVGEYKDKIKFIPQMHGGVILFNTDELTKRIYKLASNIGQHYSDYVFRYFSRPADEPIMALAMTVCDAHPIELPPPIARQFLLFYPLAVKVDCNLSTGKLRYMDMNGYWTDNVKILHWQNANTKRAKYKIEVARITTHVRVFFFVKVFCYYCFDFYQLKVLRYFMGGKRKLWNLFAVSK